MCLSYIFLLMLTLAITVRYHIPRSWLQTSNNLLVMFEEIGGDPLKISVKLHATEIICAEISETSYPPIHMWSDPSIISRKIAIHEVAPEMNLACDDGQVIEAITFASYGTPKGSCQKYSRGQCHAPNSFSLVTEVSICGFDILCHSFFLVPSLVY